MRILFTNNTLDKPAGTELSLRDAVVRLKDRGHEITCFSRQHGAIASVLKDAGIHTVTRLSDIPDSWVPDVIHGHHEWEASLAAIHFPTRPVISFCRGIHAWQEAPCTAPNVARYAVVDTGCRDRLVKELSIPGDSVAMILNGIALDSFPERNAYNEQVKSVLVFSNYAREDNYLGVIRAACEAENVPCEAVGNGVGRSVSNPSEYLRKADLVFAKGKAALEACASGAQVVVCDEPGIAPEPVTPDNFRHMRELSFGYPLMTEPHRVEIVRRHIQGYRSKNAVEVCHLARESASIEATVDHLETLYRDVESEWAQNAQVLPMTLESMSRWAAGFFEEKTAAYKLGRESQEIWRNIDNDDAERHNPPASPGDEVIESHRVLDSLRKFYNVKGELKEARHQLKKMEKPSHRKKLFGKGWFRKEE